MIEYPTCTHVIITGTNPFAEKARVNDIDRQKLETKIRWLATAPIPINNQE